MEDQNKSGNSQIPQLPPEIQTTDLLVLQQLLTETESIYSSEIINPVELNFIPQNTWSQQKVSLHFLHEDYFGRKNNVNRRFENKLWNALLITSANPSLVKFIGVMWVTNSIIKVYKYPFAKLLNITAVDGGLFHKQGNFTRHGFVTISEAEAKASVPPEYLEDVDYRDVLLITHSGQAFTKDSTEESISQCKWDNPTSATRVATLKTDILHAHLP